MSILDNELVRKYFGSFAKPVLDAMQQPIRKGERILVIRSHDGSIMEDVAIRDCDYMHPFDLRLPDEFQKKECDCLCHKGQYCCECKNTFPKPTYAPDCKPYTCCDNGNFDELHQCQKGKPTPSPEKCEFHSTFPGARPHGMGVCSCEPDAAEEKIKTLCISLGVNLANSKYATFVSNMIDLVAFVRAEKK